MRCCGGFLTRFSAALAAFPCSPGRVPGLGAGCAVPQLRGRAEAHRLPPAARGVPGGLRGSGLHLVLHRCAQRSLVLLPRGQSLWLRPQWGRRADGQRLEVSACGPSGTAWPCPTATAAQGFPQLIPHRCDTEGKGHLPLCLCHRPGASLTTSQVRNHVQAQRGPSHPGSCVPGNHEVFLLWWPLFYPSTSRGA